MEESSKDILVKLSFADPQKKVLWLINCIKVNKFFIQIFFMFFRVDYLKT